MQVRGCERPRGQQQTISASLRSLREPGIRPPTPQHRALAWRHQAWSRKPLEMNNSSLPQFLSSQLSAGGTSPSSRRRPELPAAAADTTINIRTYSVADSFTLDLLGLLGPIEEHKSNSRSTINDFREFRLNI